MESNKVRNIVILSARCSQWKQAFGIRMERRGQSMPWEATWSFALREGAGKKEGYDKTRIDGGIGIGSGYPGCPHCKAPTFFLCGHCQQIGCWDGVSRQMVCSMCQNSNELTETITHLDAGTDR